MAEDRGSNGRRAGRGPGAGRSLRTETSVSEWVVAALSTVLVLGTVAFLFVESLRPAESVPRVSIEVDTIVAAGAHWVVEFRARNLGRATAAGLVVEGELRSDTGSVERATTTLDYLPGESSRAGGLLFRRDPRRHTLEIQPRGYDRP